MPSFNVTSVSNVREEKESFLVIPAIGEPPLPIGAIDSGPPIGRVFIVRIDKSPHLGKVHPGTRNPEQPKVAPGTLYLQLARDAFKQVQATLADCRNDAPVEINWRADSHGFVLAFTVDDKHYATTPRTDPSQLKTG